MLTQHAAPVVHPLVAKVDRRRKPGRREEILQAAITLLEKENHWVTTADLARAVGLTEAALYRHFSGKYAIFLALTGYLRDNLLPETQSRPLIGSPLQKVRALCEYQLDFLAAHPGLCRIFLVEGGLSRSECSLVHELVQECVQQIRTLLAAARAQGELPDACNPEQGATFFVGLIQAAILRFVLSDFTVPPTTEIPLLWGYFCRGAGVSEMSDRETRQIPGLSDGRSRAAAGGIESAAA